MCPVPCWWTGILTDREAEALLRLAMNTGMRLHESVPANAAAHWDY